jgi:Dihydrofolate reductase
MRKLIVSAAMSLDGYIAGPHGEGDWVSSGEEIWKHMFNDLADVDTVLLGSNTYAEYAGYWRSVLTDPDADPHERKYAQWAEGTPHILFSKTVQSIDWANSRIARDPYVEVTSLKQQSGKSMVAWGAGEFASALFRMGLVDELRITIAPVLLGNGLSLFQGIDRTKLKAIEVRPLESGAVILRYGMNAGR